MKHSDLRLDTVYADHDGRALVLLSLGKFAKPRRGYGARTIRPAAEIDRSFGILALRASYAHRDIEQEALLTQARKRAIALPDKESMVGDFEVVVLPLRLVVDEWADYRAKVQAAADRQLAAAEADAAVRAERAALLERVNALLPENIELRNFSTAQDSVGIKLTDLLTILETRTP